MKQGTNLHVYTWSRTVRLGGFAPARPYGTPFVTKIKYLFRTQISLFRTEIRALIALISYPDKLISYLYKRPYFVPR